MLGKALFLLSGNASAAVFTLARNLLVARLLPVADYGVAATFAMVMAVVEMASALGLQQQIVQARDGEDPRLQAALQGFQVLRGLVSGLTLFLIAAPVAGFLGIPQAAWAYQVLAVVPVLNALQHFDIYRLQRGLSYLPVILTVSLPALLSLLAIWPLALLLGDWQVMLWAIVLQAVVALATSHLMAKRRYALAFDRAAMARGLRFGWPILGDAVLLFFVFHGEKLIIGREMGMEALGLFAMGVTLTLTPTLVAARSAQNLFLPRLSRARHSEPPDLARFQLLARGACEANLVFGMALAAGTLLLGGPFVQLVLGAKYEPMIPVLGLLGLLQGLRVFKEGPSAVALSLGQTENALLANLPRVAMLPVAWQVAVRGGGMEAVVTVAILAELAGIAVAYALLGRRMRVGLRPLALPLAAALTVMAAVWLGRDAGLWAALAVCSLCLAALVPMRALRRAVGQRGGT